MKKSLFVSSLFLLLVGCQTVKPADNTKTFYIDSTLADCVGVAPMKCMKVKQFDVANPPADAPNVRYELVEIINKAK